MMKFLSGLFSKKDSSAATATHRMKLMLTHDRQQVNPGVMEQMKEEILEVISKYFDIDPAEAEFIIQASNQDAESVFSSKVPLIKGVKFKNTKVNNHDKDSNRPKTKDKGNLSTSAS